MNFSCKKLFTFYDEKWKSLCNKNERNGVQKQSDRPYRGHIRPRYTQAARKKKWEKKRAVIRRFEKPIGRVCKSERRVSIGIGIIDPDEQLCWFIDSHNADMSFHRARARAHSHCYANGCGAGGPSTACALWRRERGIFNFGLFQWLWNFWFMTFPSTALLRLYIAVGAGYRLG